MSRKMQWLAGGGALAVLLALRLWLQVFSIPQNGMFPSYPASTKVLAAEYLLAPASIERGEVVVYTQQGPTGRYDFIWRVIGLPGETVEVRDDVVLIDGAPLAQAVQSGDGEVSVRREQAGAGSYLIAVPTKPTRQEASNHPPVVVPAGNLFLMGDNRHHAHDSRATGCVPMQSVRARVLATLVAGSQSP